MGQPAGDGLERNVRIAAALREAASLLEQQKANSFRVMAYLKAADAIAALDRDLRQINAEGPDALEAIPHVGPGISAAIRELLTTGRWIQLERLRGGLEAEALFQSIPGLGPELAHRIHEQLKVETLDELEAAAHDGRLAGVPGMGPRRAAIIRSTLAERLARLKPARTQPREEKAPGVDVLLDVDREYRERAEAGTLQLIAPKRFNPDHKAWLPILHTERGNWHFTAVYSNTARAHELGKTHDWVVIFFAEDREPESQCTVVSETSGSQKGLRVVRGREAECAALQRAPSPASSS